MKPDPTIFRTIQPRCPACLAARVHTVSERSTHHPLSGHGFDRGQWTHYLLTPEPIVIAAPQAAAAKGAK